MSMGVTNVSENFFKKEVTTESEIKKGGWLTRIKYFLKRQETNESENKQRVHQNEREI